MGVLLNFQNFEDSAQSKKGKGEREREKLLNTKEPEFDDLRNF